MSREVLNFANLDETAAHVRDRLQQKRYVLLFACNGTGKTRLSMAFKDQGRNDEQRDTLYFNAFTEDLFSWDNDLEGDRDRVLRMNRDSHFFDGLVELAIDEQEAYGWVRYIYVDDPISSLDDNHAIAVASHLAQRLKSSDGRIRTVISSHHHLFFNVMCNELGKAVKYFMSEQDGQYRLKDTGDTPRFHHVALLRELHEVAESGQIYTYHFNVLRNILEKTATFHGFSGFSHCIKQSSGDTEGVLHTRMVNLLSHGNYSLYNPTEMLPENKDYFRSILKNFMNNYRFNSELFREAGGSA